MAKVSPTIDGYLSALPVSERAVLQTIRQTVAKLAPDAVEAFSYGLPAFKLNGKPLVAFGASAKHCSFFPMTGSTVAQFEKELKAFETSKGTIRFTPEKPLPVALVRKIVKVRIAEVMGQESDVDALLNAMTHPLKAEILLVRGWILKASKTITESTKWNSLSFKTEDEFATVNLRCMDQVQLVFHRGAKKKELPRDWKIVDPQGLIRWLAPDRGLVSLGTGAALKKNKKTLEQIVKQWIF